MKRKEEKRSEKKRTEEEKSRDKSKHQSVFSNDIKPFWLIVINEHDK